MTVAENITETIAAIRERVHDAHAQQPADDGSGPPARDFALAITHLEDAQMRFTRGLAKLQGAYLPADLEAADAR